MGVEKNHGYSGDKNMRRMRKRQFDHHILLLQGGGALGAYQAGAYEGLAEAGLVPDWVGGISIGGSNARVIGGKPPQGRVAGLWGFLGPGSSHVPKIPPPLRDP